VTPGGIRHGRIDGVSVAMPRGRCNSLHHTHLSGRRAGSVRATSARSPQRRDSCGGRYRGLRRGGLQKTSRRGRSGAYNNEDNVRQVRLTYAGPWFKEGRQAA